jgi:hypothetical protein
MKINIDIITKLKLWKNSNERKPIINKDKIIDKEVQMVSATCPCPKNCKRHGNCEACQKHHKRPTNRPYCKRNNL